MDNKDNKLKTILRWVAFIPAAVVGSIAETDVDDAEGMGRHLCHYCAERLYCEEEGEDYEFEW